MAGLTAQERLQPSLLDRLTDDAPSQRSEPPEARVLSRRQLRDAVLRDLTWLFNAVCEEPPITHPDVERVRMWQDAPMARESVLNFGIPPLSGATISVQNFPILEEQIRQAVIRFEPRIDPKTAEIRILSDFSLGVRPTNLRLSIKGQLWNQPVPLELMLAAEVDVDTGEAAVRDLRA